MTDQQKQVLEVCCGILADIPNINRGGCGIAAYTMYLYLKKHNCLTENFQLILMDDPYWSCSHERNKQYLEGNTKYAEGASHIGITFDNGITIYDCYGRYYNERLVQHLLVPHGKIEDYIKIALKASHWNPEFDRQKSILYIAGALGIDLSKFLN